MVFDLHDVAGFGDDDEPESDLLSEVSAPLPNDDDIVDFTFRIPRALLNEAKALARERGCSTNAAFAALVDIGLRARGRSGIKRLAPSYIAYLRRGRRPDPK
jgi:hypothetical protein